MALTQLKVLIDRMFHQLSTDHHSLLAALKGLRNGLIYGAKVRAPHALVTVLLFAEGRRLMDKLREVFTLTRRHATNLGCFVFGYKAVLSLLRYLQQRHRQWHPLVSAALVGYFVFGAENGVNTQINLYLLSRVLYALAKLSAEKGHITPSFPAFPVFSAVVWGLVLWLFEHHPQTVQKSLQSSMEYLYHESDSWHGIRDFLLT